MRGTGEGHYDWDLKPQSKMTMSMRSRLVAGVDGQILSVKYKDGEKKLLVTPETIVVTYVRQQGRPEAGTKIFVSARKSSLTYGCKTPGVLLTAGMARVRHFDSDMVSAALSTAFTIKSRLQPGGHNAFNRFDGTGSLRHCGHEFTGICANAGASACNATGAASLGRDAGRGALRYSLRFVDRA